MLLIVNCQRYGQSNYHQKPDGSDQIQEKIVLYYKNLINDINLIIPQYFPNEKPNNIKKFSKFLLNYVYISL